MSTTRNAPAGRGLAHSLAVLTGVGGLGSEVVYLKALDFSVGSSPVVTPVVVATFIVGVGVGSLFSARVRRPWVAEVVLAVLSTAWLLAFPFLSSAMGSLVVSIAGALGISASSALLGAASVAVPAVLLGVTLPAVIEIVGSVGRGYAYHALGAFLAIVAVEGWLYPTWGLRAAFAFLVATHVTVAVLLWLTSARALERVRVGRFVRELGVAGTATGLFQGAALLLASVLFRPFYYVGPGVIAVFLCGHALGAVAWYRLRLSFHGVLVASAVGMAATGMLVACVTLRPMPGGAPAALSGMFVLMAPAAIPIGALLPAFVHERSSSRTKTGGALLSLGAGNALGLVASVVLSALLPAPWVAAVAGLVLVSVFARRAPLVAAGAVLVLALGAFFTNDTRLVQRSEKRPGVEVHEIFRGPGELTAIYSVPRREGSERRLYQTGYSPVGLQAEPGMRMESSIGAFGVAYARRLRRALVLGAGSGRTAGFVATAFARTDVIDVGATVPPLLERLHELNYGVATNPRVTYHEMDAVLAPSLFEPRAFDLIVHTVHPGYVDRAAKLYTQEYLHRLADLLAPDGVLVAWSDRSISPAANAVLYSTFASVFAHRDLLSVHAEGRASYFAIVLARAPLRYRRQNLAAGPLVDDTASIDLRSSPLDRRRLSPPSTGERVHRFDRPAIEILLGGHRWHASW